MSLKDGYDTLLSQFGSTYGNNVAADALIYNYYMDPYEKYGVRVEVPLISKEFSNGVPMGRDPAGNLFFDNVDELGKTGGASCSFDLLITPPSISHDQRAFVLIFYHTTPDQAFAKFLARDLNGTVTKELTGQSGNWADLNVASAAMHVVKVAREDFWTLTIPSLNKQATITYKTPVHDHVDIWGTLTYKRTEDISSGIWVDYRYDRMVFTTTQYSDADFCSYFIPPELIDDPQPLGTYNFSSNKVLWF